jgi:hypothetical protein
MAPPPMPMASPACHGQIGYVSADGRCYFTLTEPVTWHKARDECQEAGAHLATLTSDGELEFVVSFAAEEYAWLGLSRFGATKFSWITGEVFGFANWEPDAPRQAPESAAVIAPDTGLWSDRHPMEMHFALCETEAR